MSTAALLQEASASVSDDRARWIESFRRVRDETERRAAPLSPEDQVIQSMPDASPIKWHRAHTTWFFETFLVQPNVPGYMVFDERFAFLFNSYYVAAGPRHARPKRGLITRPNAAEVAAYRAHVDAAVEQLIGEAGSAALAEILRILEIGLNHEEQHQELMLTDVKHLLSRNPLAPAYAQRWPLTPVRARRMRWVPVNGGAFDVGHGGTGFAFDNEGPRHRVLVNDFELASHPVTYGEYLAFIEDGGYRRPELWLSLGWDTVRTQEWEAPLYWQQRDGRWYNFTLHGMFEIEPNTPVCHISFFEADAYARWTGARLPTEFEWEIAASALPLAGNFLDSGALHPLAPRTDPHPAGLAQMYGDVWQWTQSSYAPYPGFRAAPGAVGEYNGKFMCNQYVLRGGSCATPARHIRATYRNFFPPDARWQFSGLRLARDAA